MVQEVAGAAPVFHPHMFKFLRKPQSIQAIYLWLTLGNTLAASFIWGINTIFLLSAGLSNFEAFLANAFFSIGEVIFEVPTGIIADTYGRRVSYLLGGITLSVSTLLYLFMWEIKGPFWGWALSSIILGLGFTFFSGSTEAWLVDALHFTNFKGHIDGVFAKAQIVGGLAMLSGAFLGGYIAQITNLGVPYILRAAVLLVNFATAFFLMKDLGFKPRRMGNLVKEVEGIWEKSIENGLKNPSVKWLMLAAPLTSGVGFYVFYALQPFLLKLYGDEKAYMIAGLVASLAASAQIAGGILSPKIRSLFATRTSTIFSGIVLSALILSVLFYISNFWIALVLIFIWGLTSAAITPIRMAFINGNIVSAQRATVLSFDSMMGSAGAIGIQPILGKVADFYSYSSSFFVASIIQVASAPFILLSRREKSKADIIKEN